jgi:hypothetical protein
MTTRNSLSGTAFASGHSPIRFPASTLKPPPLYPSHPGSRNPHNPMKTKPKRFSTRHTLPIFSSPPLRWTTASRRSELAPGRRRPRPPKPDLSQRRPRPPKPPSRRRRPWRAEAGSQAEAANRQLETIRNPSMLLKQRPFTFSNRQNISHFYLLPRFGTPSLISHNTNRLPILPPRPFVLTSLFAAHPSHPGAAPGSRPPCAE